MFPRKEVIRVNTNLFIVFILSLFLYGVSPLYSQDIAIDGKGEGAKFEGIGIVSAGASTRQLVDYPEPYRSDILDWLFKPGFGMGLQHLKVEIGGDVNSTCGSEPSYAHTQEEMSQPNYQRGYEYWLMKEAKKRNPKILLEGLSWGAPYFVKEHQEKDKHAGQFYTPACADWLIGFLKGARAWGVELDYLAAEQNESPPSPTWEHAAHWVTDVLRPKLDQAGFEKVKLVADGISHNVFTRPGFADNKAYRKLIVSTGDHYMYGKKPWPQKAIEESIKEGVPVWNNEAFCGSGKTWERSMWVAEEIPMLYSRFRAVKYQAWTPLGASLVGTKYVGLGFLSAVDPWSGYYQVYPVTWVCAHFTHFVEVGWRYLDSGTGSLYPGKLPKYDDGVGWRSTYEIPGTATFRDKETTKHSERARLRYVTFVSPDQQRDFSIVVVNTSEQSHPISFALSNLSNKPIHVWKSNRQEQFIESGTLERKGNRIELQCDPESVYTLTTTTGQKKSEPPHPIPEKAPMALPYVDHFESDPVIGHAPKYSQDQVGSFEIWREPAGNLCVRQMSPKPGLLWANEDKFPCTAIGDSSLRNYTVSSDVMIEGQGNAALWARVGRAQAEGLDGYRIKIDEKGEWTLAYEKMIGAGKPSEVTLLAKGTMNFSADQWHQLKLRCHRTQITAWVDGTQVAQVEDKASASGKVGYSSGYHYARFDNLKIESIPGEVTARLVRAVANSNHPGFEAANAIDGNPSTMWHAEWMPLAPLPQALTVEMAKEQLIRAIRFLPRAGASSNANTKVRVLVSCDGKEYQQVVQEELAPDDTEKELKFPAPVKARFVKLEVLATVRGAACLSELNVMVDEGAH